MRKKNVQTVFGKQIYLYEPSSQKLDKKRIQSRYSLTNIYETSTEKF